MDIIFYLCTVLATISIMHTTYDNIRLNYTVSGEGRAVILMHGWGCDLSIFASTAALLSEHFRVYSIDFPGFGQSDEPTSVWGIEDYTRAFEHFVREAAIDEPILIGHSFGGRVAILFASRNKTHKVILVDAAGVRPRHSLSYYIKVYSYKTMKRVLPIVLGKASAERIIDSYRKKSGSSDYNNATPMMRAILSKVVNEDLCKVMPQIKAPTLLIWGENDTATPLADAKIMCKLIKDSGLVVVQGAGHFSFLDNFGLYATVLDNFLHEDFIKK